MPHIVIGDPSQRTAKIDAGSRANPVTVSFGAPKEHYLGVWVREAPDKLAPGQSADVTFVLMCWPDESYEDVVAGANVTLREGPLIVGSGHIISATVG